MSKTNTKKVIINNEIISMKPKNEVNEVKEIKKTINEDKKEILTNRRIEAASSKKKGSLEPRPIIEVDENEPDFYKNCKKCDTLKPSSEFRRSNATGYFYSYCKECSKKMSREHYQAHRVVKEKKPRAHFSKITDRIKEQYASGMNIKSIAEANGVTAQTIYRWAALGFLERKK